MLKTVVVEASGIPTIQFVKDNETVPNPDFPSQQNGVTELKLIHPSELAKKVIDGAIPNSNCSLYEGWVYGLVKTTLTLQDGSTVEAYVKHNVNSIQDFWETADYTKLPDTFIAQAGNQALINEIKRQKALAVLTEEQKILLGLV